MSVRATTGPSAGSGTACRDPIGFACDHRNVRALAPFALAGLGLGTGCYATYAPPARTLSGGAPGRLMPGQMEVTGAGIGFIAPIEGGGGAVGYAARPHLVVTGGVDGMKSHVLGWGGVRTPFRLHLRPKISLAADGELGVGVGVGGRNDCDNSRCEDDDIAWYRRPAGGGYLGAGGAVRFGPVSIYSRARAQVTGAKHIPATQWATIAAGLHFHILDRADVWIAETYGRYDNDTDNNAFLFTELGLGFRFDPYLGWR